MKDPFEERNPMNVWLKECSFPLQLKTYGPRSEKNCLPGFRPGHAQTSLLSYRD